MNNPTNDVLERRISTLEKGVSSLAFASGQAARFLTILNLAYTGDNIVAPACLDVGTFELFMHSLPRS